MPQVRFVSSSRSFTKILLFLALLAMALPGEAYGQQPSAQEMTTTNQPFTLKVQRNEVPVRVIVRDRRGRAIKNLNKENFQVLDNGKPQVITQFSVESAAKTSLQSAEKAVMAVPGLQTSAPKIADRFMAFYFDDLVMNFEQVARTRAAASKYLQTSLQKTDRVAVYTSSGQVTEDFTSDRDKIDAALQRLRPVNIFGQVGNPCPDLSDYEAYQITELENKDALAIATQKVINCRCGGDPSLCIDAVEWAKASARSRWSQAEMQQSYSLRGLDDLVRQLAVLPGQRGVIFVSPGFLTGLTKDLTSMVISRAVRAGVFISSLDARGLYTLVPGGDASQGGPGLGGRMGALLVAYESASAHEDSGVLEEISDGTGGVLYDNSNDFDAGLRSAGILADFSYILVFSPDDLKPDGKYHKLKVELVGDAAKKGLTVQARRGYFAAIQSKNPADTELVELSSAVFSRLEVNSERLQIATQFSKTAPTEAEVKVKTHVDIQGLTFKDESDRHVANVVLVTAIFDTNGNFVQGLRKDVQLRLQDRTLEYLRSSGISVTSDFKLAPGNYAVREVFRDEAGEISTVNGSVEIPY